MPEFELVESFRASRKVAKRAKVKFEGIRALQSIAKEEGTKIIAHAGMTAFDLVTAHEARKLVDEHGDVLNQRSVEAAVNAKKRSRTTTISEYLTLGMERQVLVYEEGGGDLALGIPFTSETKDTIIGEREVLAGCLSVVAKSRITLPDENAYRLTIAKMAMDRMTDAQAGVMAGEAERILWPEFGAGIGTTVDLYDVEVYNSRALINASNA